MLWVYRGRTHSLSVKDYSQGGGKRKLPRIDIVNMSHQSADYFRPKVTLSSAWTSGRTLRPGMSAVRPG